MVNKFIFYKRLGDSYRDLALYLGIPRQERELWETGTEGERILEWLENRERLDELPKALVEIEREDLVELLEGSESSNPLEQFFEHPPTEVQIEIQNANQRQVGNIKNFFRGYSDAWEPVQSGIALSRRVKQKYGDSLDLSEFAEKLLSDSALKFIKIFGAGGSGKTTFSKMVALKLAQHQSSPTVLLRNIESEQITKEEAKSLVQGVESLDRKLSGDERKLFLVYDNPILSDRVPEVRTLVWSLRNTSNTVVIVLEREDEWLAAYKRAKGRRQPGEETFFLEEQLRNDEIEELCNTIENLQSNLPDTRILSENRDINDFRQSLNQGNPDILLVAMYEATTGEKIEETIINEFEGIPDEDAKRLYEFICGLTFYSIKFPYYLALALYGSSKLKNIKNQHLAGIIHERKKLLFARHQRIAEILWCDRNPDCETEIRTLAEFLTELSYRRGYKGSVNLDGFSSQVFKLLTTHPNLQPISLPFLGDIVDGLSNVTESDSTGLLYRQAGQYLEKQGERKKAIAQYKKSLQKYSNPDHFILLSQVLQKAGDSQEAIAVLREGIQKAPNPALYQALSQALQKRENGLDEAISVLREGTQKTPNADLYVALSQALQKQENGLDEAIIVLREGTQKTPNPALYEALSQALQKRKNGLDEAIAVLREGIQKTPKPDLYYALSQALLKQENGLDEAITVLREGIQKTPNFSLYIALSQALLKQENGLNEAIIVLRKGIQKNPYFSLYIALSEALLKQKNGLNEAIAVLYEGIQKDKNYSLYYALSRVLQMQEDGLDEAITVLREGIQKTPDHRLYIALSQALQRQENGLDEAITVLREGIQKTPYSGFYYALSEALQKQENGLDEAITVLREGIQKTPNYGLYIALSETLQKRENGLDEAITMLRQGIQKTSSPKVYLALSQTLQRQENSLEQAIAICKKTPSHKAYLVLSKALLKRKNSLEEAIAVLGGGIKKFPNNSTLYFTLSQALIIREKILEKATVILRKGIQKIPNDTSLSQTLRRVIDKRKNGLDTAFTVLQKGTKRFPKHSYLYITLCQLLMLRENTLDKGTAMLRKGIQKFPNDPRVYMALSEALLSQENGLEKSIAILREGIQNAPEIYRLLRQTLLNQENTLEKGIAMWQAIVVLREGIERAPDPDVYTELKVALSESKTNGFADTIAALREDLQKRKNLSNFCKIVEDYLQDIDLGKFVEKYYSEIAKSRNEREINALVENLDQHGHTELAVNLLDAPSHP